MTFLIYHNDLLAMTSRNIPMRVVFGRDDPPAKASMWSIEQVEGGVTIRNVDNDFYAYDQNNDLIVSPIRLTPTVWSIEPAGGGDYVIKVANEDLVWTRVSYTITLRPADGSPQQRFRLGRSQDGVYDRAD